MIKDRVRYQIGKKPFFLDYANDKKYESANFDPMTIIDAKQW